ncbi:hypothetical protein V2A60_004447 [Cordyceps javanica]|uniref:RNA recognition domain-containing protein n=1 Tax=Cordyceps javanica TaxID=43265 RepID=A0A545URP6_9HYPO|nr:RNA recognition domain-containing protein [Cordyceps javanica]TQW04066.1 RNA recognition domain-containing protein [Cordyceps javanica]
MAQNRHWEQDKDATIYMGNIDERATPAMMYEIMLQMGPIHNIHMPRDRVTQSHQGFGFVEFRTPSDAEYAAAVMNGIKLFGKSLRVNKASADRQRAATDIGAELFVGSLDPAADEKMLYDTFSRFGPLLSLPKIARDDAGASRGFGFISFADFESADAAIENLGGQYLLGNQVTVQYAFKKDGKGERHGDEAERELAAQAKKRNVVPEAQPVPAAFLNPPPASSAPPVGAPPPAASATPQPPAGFAPPPNMPPGMHMGGPPPHMGAPPGFAPPPHSHQRGPSPYNAPPGQGPPPAVGGRGGVPPPGSMPLPPAPSGLPARPPQSQGGYTNPADYHPNGGSYRGSGASPAPPPGFPGAPQQQQQPPQQQPPPGFGAPGGAPAPPPGFMPPPGFPQQPPPGYPRR